MWEGIDLRGHDATCSYWQREPQFTTCSCANDETLPCPDCMQVECACEPSVAERYEDALEWYQRADKDEITSVLMTDVWQRSQDDWARVAVIALDEADMLGARGRRP